MESERFDTIARSLATAGTRRGMRHASRLRSLHLRHRLPGVSDLQPGHGPVHRQPGSG